MTFSLQWSQQMSREQVAVINAGCDYRVEKRCTPGLIPIGDVPYCEAVFGPQPGLKDFYPAFLSNFMCRTWSLYPLSYRYIEAGVFAKDATKWKSPLGARITSSDERMKVPHYVSEVVEFVDEWRYYVADGRIVMSGWYQGEHEDVAAPPLDVDWPQGFSGAVDFGTLRDGRLALVEAHAPFACGFYGDDPKLYAEWQRIAWEHADFWKV